MPISAISLSGGSLLTLQIRELVSNGKYGKIISHDYEKAFRYQLFAAGAHVY
jgi:hypothetical protein